jgi:hypothetical protein
MRALLIALGLVATLVVATFAVSALRADPQTTTETIGGLTLVRVARAGVPGIQESAARQTALNKVASLNDRVTDFRAKTSAFKTGLLKAVDSSGTQILAENTPRDAWVFEVTGSSKDYAQVTGIVIVDATTGDVVGISLFQTNE